MDGHGRGRRSATQHVATRWSAAHVNVLAAVPSPSPVPRTERTPVPPPSTPALLRAGGRRLLSHAHACSGRRLGHYTFNDRCPRWRSAGGDPPGPCGDVVCARVDARKCRPWRSTNDRLQQALALQQAEAVGGDSSPGGRSVVGRHAQRRCRPPPPPPAREQDRARPIAGGLHERLPAGLLYPPPVS